MSSADGTERMLPHRVTAVLRLAGRHATRVEIQHPGTPEAVATMNVGRAVVYLHTRAAADQLGAMADRAAKSALRLPTMQPLLPPAARPPGGHAEASIIVHTRGAPGGVVHLVPRAAPRAPYLHVQLGELVFRLHDKLAAESCIGAFRQVARLADQLTDTDLRHATAAPAREPSLHGADANLARAELDHGSGSTAERPDAALAQAQEALAQARAAMTRLAAAHRAAGLFRPPDAVPSPAASVREIPVQPDRPPATSRTTGPTTDPARSHTR